jgi:hypothetical protein
MFEAISFKTALVLFEGEYSGVLQPLVHYIPLKKDFSNVDDVLSRLKCDDYLQELTDRAYSDIIGSDRFSYKSFVKDFDNLIARSIKKPVGTIFVTGLVAQEVQRDECTQFEARITQCTTGPVSASRSFIAADTHNQSRLPTPANTISAALYHLSNLLISLRLTWLVTLLTPLGKLLIRAVVEDKEYKEENGK